MKPPASAPVNVPRTAPPARCRLPRFQRSIWVMFERAIASCAVPGCGLITNESALSDCSMPIDGLAQHALLWVTRSRSPGESGVIDFADGTGCADAHALTTRTSEHHSGRAGTL